MVNTLNNKRIIYLLLGMITICACARNTNPPIDNLCSKNLIRADALFIQKKDNLTKAERKRIQNLIKSARIQQQHEEYAACNDRVHRALDLMINKPKD